MEFTSMGRCSIEQSFIMKVCMSWPFQGHSCRLHWFTFKSCMGGWELLLYGLLPLLLFQCLFCTKPPRPCSYVNMQTSQCRKC